MSKFVEASFVLLLSVVITTFIMVFVIPVHAFGGASRVAAGEDIRPAVFVESSAECPGAMGQAQQCPFLAQRSSGTACPYLSALSAREIRALCPYLADQDHSDSRMRAARVKATAESLSS